MCALLKLFGNLTDRRGRLSHGVGEMSAKQTERDGTVSVGSYIVMIHLIVG